MKRSAFLINVCRGAVVQEEALVTALRDGTIAGAALDVFETEPLPHDSELWSMDNVIISPHVSSWSTDYRQRAAQVFVENLERYLNKQPMLHLVDPLKGY